MIKLGEVFSIEVEGGLGFLQITAQHKLMGSLIRVLPGTYAQGPSDLNALVQRETGFWTFFPVPEMFKAGIIKKEGNFSIPSHASAFPLFRTGVADPATKRVENWWLWDGDKEWRIGKLRAEQRRLPIRAIWNDTLLRERIAEGWRSEFDPR